MSFSFGRSIQFHDRCLSTLSRRCYLRLYYCLAEVKENEPEKQIVAIKASDIDLGINAEIEFAMENNDLFAIDALTGIVKTLRPLDREEQDRYELKVTAHDKGTPRLSSTSILKVKVQAI